MNVGSLFTGIGGLDLGLERAGFTVKWQCEIDEFCRAVLRKHWPDVPCYADIRDIDESAERVDLICGGFPCQPVSLAGRGLAQSDPRWLWPEFERVVGLLRPRYVLVENVPGLATRGLGDVVGSLTALGYDAEWDLVSAASVGAPHLRERIFIVAYAASSGNENESSSDHSEGQSLGALTGTVDRVARGRITEGATVTGRGASLLARTVHPDSKRERLEESPQPDGQPQAGEQARTRGNDTDGLRDALAHPNGSRYGPDTRSPLGYAAANGAQRGLKSRSSGEALADSNDSRFVRRPRYFTEENWRREPPDGRQWAVEPDVGRVAYGVPRRVDRLRTLGNAVVPQVGEFVGCLLMEAA